MLPLIAYFFLTLAPIVYGLINVLLKRGTHHTPPFAAIAISMGTLCLLAVLCTYCFEKNYWNGATHSINKKEIATLVLAGTCNVLAFWCLLRSYQYAPVWQYQMFSLLTPVFSSIFAYFLIGEPFSSKMFIGLSIVSIGLFIAVR